MTKSYIKNFFIITLGLSLAFSALAAEKITMSGSDLLKPVIADKLSSLSKNDNQEIAFNMTGTYTALKDLEEGKAEVAIIALPKGNAIPEGLIAWPVAYQVAIVVANTVNPIEEISTKQLYDIFSKNAENRVETWNQIGVKNVGLRNILALVTDFGTDVVVELFKFSALKSTNLGSWVSTVKDKNAVFTMIKANNSAIGIVGKLTDTNMLKAIAVSDSEASKSGTSYAFKPDKDNIFNGDYPMVLPFYVVYKKENSQKVKKVIRNILSDDIAQKIDTTDFFSAPKNSRKKSIFELDNLR